MKRIIFVLTFFLLLSIPSYAQAQDKVDKKNSESKIKLEQLISGHLQELNGKYKMRVTETTYLPEGYIGNHQHSGPGIRYILSGELVYVQSDTAKIYKAGDCFFEPGDITHHAYNKTKEPVVILNVDILPADWEGATAIPPVSEGKH
jgi:quercetin dioxygenase-like cupin family protein